MARVLAGHRAEKTCWSNGVSGYRSADLWGEWQRRRRGFGSSTTNGVAMDAYLLCCRFRSALETASGTGGGRGGGRARPAREWSNGRVR